VIRLIEEWQNKIEGKYSYPQDILDFGYFFATSFCETTKFNEKIYEMPGIK